MQWEGSELARQYNLAGDSGLWQWLLLPMRLILFVVFQGSIALIAWGSIDEPWATSLSWWPFGVLVTNIITVVVLIKLFAAEGHSYFSVQRTDATWGRMVRN